MFRTKQKKYWLSILLLAFACVTMLALFAIGGAADGVSEHTLTVTVPADSNFGTVELTIGNNAPEILESGKVYTITSGVRYRLTARAESGYKASWSNLTAGAGTPQLEGAANTDINYEVRFIPETYKINYVDENLYSFVSEPPRTHTYKSTVSIPNVTRSGYEMTGWILYYSDPTESTMGGLPCEKDYSASFSASEIWLKPMWEGDEYCVIRLDCWYKEKVPYNNGGYLGYQIVSGEMGSMVNGTVGDATLYKGYTFLNDPEIYDYEAHAVEVSISEAYNDEGMARILEKIADIYGNPDLQGYNIVFRYYLPNRYTVDVDLNAEGDDVSYEDGKTMPTHHVYNENTSIPNPVRAGYDFSHWIITVNGVAQPNAYPGYTIVQESVEGNISLKAVWTPKKFPVEYVWNGRDAEENAVIEQLNSTLLGKFNTYTYGTPSAFPYPVRTGYVFDGWIVTQNGEAVYEAPVKDLPDDLFKKLPMGFTLEAQWRAATYTVTLNGNGADAQTHPTLTVTFDSALDTTGVQIPVRFGYTFLGYFTDAVAGEQYINADGSSACALWTLAEDTVLYAHWQELPHVEKPDFLIDYVKEVFYCEDGRIPVGRYTFSYGETVIDVVVTENAITVNGNIVAATNAISIPDEFVGQTVQLTVHGDGTTTSHNRSTISINARPAAPTGVSENDDIISIVPGYTDIRVKMDPSLAEGFVYEFAISMNGNGTGLVWQDSPLFEDLKQGTIYYIYVRVKASDGFYPHGQAFVSAKNYTLYQSYVDDMKDALDSLKLGTDGEMVAQVIKTAKDAMSLLEPSADFYDTLNSIFAEAERQVIFARKQDDKLIALKNTLQTMKDSGAYHANDILILQAIYDAATESIKKSSNTDDINAIYEAAHKAMYEIRITYLVSGDMELESHAGLPQSILLTLAPISDLSALRVSFNNAVKAGNVIVGGVEMTVEEAIRQLRTKDLFAAYSMQLMSGPNVYGGYEGNFTLRLLLPQELRNVEGLRVAYYNDKTGTLELLETTVDGNCLVFTASSIGEFVILGDPTIDMSMLLMALASILLLQIIAIILLLIRRKKTAQLSSAVSYAFIPVLPLTIRVFPDYALTAVIIFGVLILLFQIFLIYLVLTSDLVIGQKKKTVKKRNEAIPEETPSVDLNSTSPNEEELDESLPTDQEAFAAQENLNEEDLAEEEPVLHTLTDDESGEELQYGVLYEEDAEEVSDPLNAYFEDDDGSAAYTSVFVSSDEEEALPVEEPHEYAYDQNGQAYLTEEDAPEEESIEGASYYGIDEAEFIEPAVNPAYSLPEEELVEEDLDAGDDFFGEEDLAMGESASFDLDDEDLATGDDYYDEPVPYDENEGRTKQ